MTTPHPLSVLESLDVESRHAELHAKILAHNQIVQSGKWSQIQDKGILESLPLVGGDFQPEDLPIPIGGLALKDSAFGNVVVFGDAAGVLHFTADVPDQVVTQIQKPAFQSPAGNAYEDYLAELQKMAKAITDPAAKLIAWLPYIAVGAVAVVVLVFALELREAV